MTYKHGLLLTAVSSTVVLCATIGTIAAENQSASFTSLFNGKDLDGWDGDPRFWRVTDGQIVGETTQTNRAEHNTFLIYRGREFGDFQLKFQYQVKGYNSGVQYRSVEEDSWVVSGYQADFEDRWHDSDRGPVDRFSGMFFEEKGRMFLAQRGEAVIVRADPEDARKPLIDKIATLGETDELERTIRRGDWNQYQIIASGFQFTHIINGRVMALARDEDTSNRRASGIIAFQLHSGPPMQIRLKDIQIRQIRR